MPYEHRIRRTIEFAETDMAGVMHFANFFRYMEATEHDFLFSLGQCAHRQVGAQTLGWPRVHASCRYAAPLKYGDVVEIHLLIVKKSKRSITYSFAFEAISRRDEPDFVRTRSAVGNLTAVYVTREQPDQPWHAQSVPAELDGLLEVAPDPLIATHTDS